jgi:hypothetical protein
LVSFRGFFFEDLYLCMVKYLNFHYYYYYFSLKILFFNVNGNLATMWHHHPFVLFCKRVVQ